MMPDSLIDLASRLFVGPVWPASILAILLVIYALLSLLGIFDLGLNAPDFDPTPSLGAELTRLIPLNWDFMQGIGGSTIRWTNFGRLPIILWGSVFAVAFWMFSYGLWHQYDSIKYMDDWLTSSVLATRNFVLAVGITKILTQPMLKHFIPPPSYDHQSLLGETCEITTSKADSKFGQAKYRTEAAPLLLNVRTDGSIIRKGERARLIDFDSKKRIYTVTRISTENDS